MFHHIICCQHTDDLTCGRVQTETPSRPFYIASAARTMQATGTDLCVVVKLMVIVEPADCARTVMDDGATKHGGQSLQPGNNQSRASATSRVAIYLYCWSDYFLPLFFSKY